MAEKGWLKKQLDEAEQEILNWPDWKKTHVDEQYEELNQYSARPKHESKDQNN